MNAKLLFRYSWPAALGLLACFLPWAQAESVALGLNLWDLAEWASLHPLSRSAEPALGVSLGLRALPLFLLALTLWQAGWPPMFRLALTLLLFIALLPPPQFFLSDLSDPNYRQHLVMATLALLTGMAGSLRATRSSWVLVLVALTASLTALVSLSAALELQRNLKLMAAPGTGIALFLLVVLARGLQVSLTRKGDPRGTALYGQRAAP